MTAGKRIAVAVLAVIALELAGLGPGAGAGAGGRRCGGLARGDTVTMKDGRIYRGDVTADGVVIMISDPLRRVFVRKTRISNQTPNQETISSAGEIRLIHPDMPESGPAPEISAAVEISPWSKDFRRQFSHIGRNGKRIEMTQVVHILGPKISEIRGLKRFWSTKVATEEVPKDLILDVLKRIRQEFAQNEDERKRIASFLIGAEWWDEALDELEGVGKDFPESRDATERTKVGVLNFRAGDVLAASASYSAVGQPKRAWRILKRLPAEGLSDERLNQLNDRARKLQEREALDASILDAVREAFAQLPEAEQGPWSQAYFELIETLSEAPDAIRDRLTPFLKAREAGETDPAKLFALALSGYSAGRESAGSELPRAWRFWEGRALVRSYLSSESEEVRNDALDRLQTKSDIDPAIVAALVRHSAPPLRESPSSDPIEKPRLIRVPGSTEDDPIEYVAILPPEYHPLRKYPMVVALHDGKGPADAAAFWEKQAMERGFIVIAPEYRLPEKPIGYKFTPEEHGAVELCLRDARRRFAIDSDRVYLAGQLHGGDMAWDYGLAHPDQFAGVAVISGLPFKYVFAYKTNADLLPLYVVQGGLTPGSEQVILDLARKLINSTVNLTYVDYPTRGQENIAGEVGPILDWMTRQKRKPFPDKFKAVSARASDNRFYGIVIRELEPNRNPDPAAVAEYGNNLKPSIIDFSMSSLGNLLKLQTQGIRQLDVWVDPQRFDFSKKLEIRINGKTRFKEIPPKDLKPLLDDLRIRGDREQAFWFKLPIGGGGVAEPGGAGAGAGGQAQP